MCARSVTFFGILVTLIHSYLTLCKQRIENVWVTAFVMQNGIHFCPYSETLYNTRYLRFFSTLRNLFACCFCFCLMLYRSRHWWHNISDCDGFTTGFSAISFHHSKVIGFGFFSVILKRTFMISTGLQHYINSWPILLMEE